MANKRNRRRNGLIEGTRGIVVGATILGVGSSVVGGIGGSTAASAQAGLGAAAGFLPVIGTAVGAGVVIRQLDNLQESTKRKRRKR